MHGRMILTVAAICLLLAPVHATHTGDHVPPGQDREEDTDSLPPPHPDAACSPPYHVHGAGWDFCWQQDDLRVQGLELNRVFFHNESVIWKMGVPFSLTDYERGFPGPFKDVLGEPVSAVLPGFGRGSMVIDDEACPRFLPQGDLLHDDRLCVEKRAGVDPAISIWARYDLFNYRFMQGYHFDSRGEIEPFLALGGHLIDGATAGADGQNHYHHIYWRVDFDTARTGNDTFQAFKHIHDDAFSIGADLPAQCEDTGSLSVSLWCDAPVESQLAYDQSTYDKWRVKDTEDLNSQGREKSFEFGVHSPSPANDFSTFDAMVLEHQGDSAEIGYEVPTRPTFGDDALDGYLTPPEPIADPVAWIVYHNHHDTRDEDRGSMTHHYTGFNMRPNNFLDENSGESTFP